MKLFLPCVSAVNEAAGSRAGNLHAGRDRREMVQQSSAGPPTGDTSLADCSYNNTAACVHASFFYRQKALQLHCQGFITVKIHVYNPLFDNNRVALVLR